MKSSTEMIVEAIKNVPAGQVASYAEIAQQAGIPNGARQVARILHTCSEKYQLPWWRIVRSNGEIALRDEAGRKEQRDLLVREGVQFQSRWKVKR